VGHQVDFSEWAKVVLAYFLAGAVIVLPAWFMARGVRYLFRRWQADERDLPERWKEHERKLAETKIAEAKIAEAKLAEPAALGPARDLHAVTVPYGGQSMLVTGLKYVFAVICFGIGGAAAYVSIDSLVHKDPYSSGDALTAMIGAMFLLIAFLLLRRPRR